MAEAERTREIVADRGRLWDLDQQLDQPLGEEASWVRGMLDRVPVRDWPAVGGFAVVMS